MPKIHKKYVEDFEKLQRTWEKYSARPTPALLEELKQDLAEVNYGMNHYKM